MAFDVFLSHDNQDYELVNRVWIILTRIKISAYMYEHYPNYGQNLYHIAIKMTVRYNLAMEVVYGKSGLFYG